MSVPTTEDLLKNTHLWSESTDGWSYLVYRSDRSFVPITGAGEVDDSRWRFIANDHYTTWNQLTIEQQQALRDRAKVLVVMERLAGNEIP